MDWIAATRMMRTGKRIKKIKKKECSRPKTRQSILTDDEGSLFDGEDGEEVPDDDDEDDFWSDARF